MEKYKGKLLVGKVQLALGVCPGVDLVNHIAIVSPGAALLQNSPFTSVWSVWTAPPGAVQDRTCRAMCNALSSC